jgi:hypothetical protein
MNNTYLVAALAAERQHRLLQEADEFRRARLARSGKTGPSRSRVRRTTVRLVAATRGDLTRPPATDGR